jgi:hypothetical protein
MRTASVRSNTPLRAHARKVSFDHHDFCWLVVVPIGLRLLVCLRLSALLATCLR